MNMLWEFLRILMALLSNCWLIIEYFIIPDGYVKWFYLSFYIHPFFLFFCQIFLWFRWLPYILVLLPFKLTCYLCSRVVVFLSCCFMYIIRSFARFRDPEVADVVPEYENIPELITRNQHQIVDSYSIAPPSVLRLIHYEVSEPESSKIGFEEVLDDEASEELENVDINEDSVELESVDINEDSSSDEGGDFSSTDQFTSSESPVASSSGDHVGMDFHIPVPLECTPNFAIMEQELIDQRDHVEEEVDPFYKSYEERMRWFDLLNHDRAFALSIIQSKQSANNIISIQGAEAGDISWDKMVKNRLLKSLENDFEMVYVAQSCLTWEALCYQHLKVKARTAECSSTCASPLLGTAFYYHSSAAVNFQKFKILLERFMEDERLAEGKRYWNYVQKRSSLKSLLQVPDISGSHMVEETTEGRMGEAAVRATDMLKAIEKCIKAFWLFLQTEKKTPAAAWCGLLRTDHSSPLEDPRDLNLFHDLTKTLRKSELLLKDLKGKTSTRRWTLKRTVNPLGENTDQKKEILFAAIEMKLVSRVLSMSTISTSQLGWCQEKLKNIIDFKEGKIICRSGSSSTGPLFPSS